jgi:hypothetical protein
MLCAKGGARSKDQRRNRSYQIGKFKPLPPDPARHQHSAIALGVLSLTGPDRTDYASIYPRLDYQRG